MSAPTPSLTGLRTSTAALLLGVDAENWTAADIREPSLLPGWTRAHVLTHIARNADGITRTLAAALRGEVAARYPDGPAGRTAAIEAGSTRGFAELAADLRESADRLDRLFVAIAEADGWDLPTEDRPARGHVAGRWREVEIHRVDLAGAYTADEWPAEFVADQLPELARSLLRRAATPMQIEVAAQGSVTADLGGRVWTVGAGDPIRVIGPDWALLAWLAGRPTAAGTVLNVTPELSPWL